MTRRIDHRVYCRWCHLEIVGCVGLDNDWMHVRDRSERCGDTFVEPETPTDVERRIQGRKLVYR